MWSKTYSTTVTNLKPYQVWMVWSDISKRHLWDLDTEWAKIDGAFKTGAIFKIKIKNGPVIKMQITDCIPNEKFTDFFKFPLAKMYGIHWMEEIDGVLHLHTSIKIEGPLSFLWRK